MAGEGVEVTGRSVSLAVLGLVFMSSAWAVTGVAPQDFIIDGQVAQTQADGPCWDASNRYVDCGNGTVTDSLTQLVWLQTGTCNELAGLGADGTASWPAALAAIASLEDGVCNLTDGSQPGDWRLPTVDEWSQAAARAVSLGCTVDGPGDPPSLTNTPGTSCYAPGPQQFAAVPDTAWTSTLDEEATDQAWRIDLLSGGLVATAKSSTAGVWPVRKSR